jgi:hypothetical protein
MPSAIARLDAELAGEGRSFRYVSPPRPDYAHILFIGRFQGEQVIWDTSVGTLTYYFRAARLPGERVGRKAGLRQFIEVGKQKGCIRRLRIGLNVARIDEPTLLKAILMIRKYKRLHAGLHEYGERWSP